MERLGLIAGNGRFPLIFAQAARSRNIGLVATAIRGETHPDLGRVVDKITWIRLGEFKEIVNIFKNEGLKKVVMAGQIKPKHLFDKKIKWDDDIKNIFKDIENRKADTIFRSIADRLKIEGIELLDSTLYLDEFLAKKGVLGRQQPTFDDWNDIYFGMEIAKIMGALDIGQTVVVKNKAILAVEAMEGTDATILRGGRLGRGEVAVVKVSKPQQDMRFDIPVVGPRTIKTLARVKARCLAIEAEKTLIIDKSVFLNLADKNNICVVGI
ncbi:MAG: UDP-2,3-diacylglucosamine diphosphatase LpxI [Candidatus Omnitrophota bacterium]